MKRVPLRRSKSFARVSAKRRAEKPIRDAVRQEVLERDQGCIARELVPEVQCITWLPLHVHEPERRSRKPGCHLDANRAVAICVAHDNWAESNITKATVLGLHIPSWEESA